jgi:hypothetical protein
MEREKQQRKDTAVRVVEVVNAAKRARRLRNLGVFEVDRDKTPLWAEQVEAAGWNPLRGKVAR